MMSFYDFAVQYSNIPEVCDILEEFDRDDDFPKHQYDTKVINRHLKKQGANSYYMNVFKQIAKVYNRYFEGELYHEACEV